MVGEVTISLEIELGWGMHDKQKYNHLSPDGLIEENTLKQLLSAADHLEIPISFDVVGHLLHDSCSGIHPSPHSDDWWDEDPGTNSDEQPLFYAPGLISEISSAEVDHEICTHTYSHALASEVDRDTMEWELNRAKDVHTSIGLPEPKSIVLPRHQSISPDFLSRQGFETVRVPFETYGPPRNDPISKWVWLHQRPHPTSEPEQINGITVTRCTPHASLTASTLPIGQSDVVHPALGVLPLRVRQYLHQRYLRSAIDRAAVSGESIHLWSHLFNMANTSQWKPIKSALKHLAKRRDEGDIKIKPMVDLEGSQ